MDLSHPTISFSEIKAKYTWPIAWDLTCLWDISQFFALFEFYSLIFWGDQSFATNRSPYPESISRLSFFVLQLTICWFWFFLFLKPSKSTYSRNYLKLVIEYFKILFSLWVSAPFNFFLVPFFFIFPSFLIHLHLVLILILFFFL